MLGSFTEDLRARQVSAGHLYAVYGLTIASDVRLASIAEIVDRGRKPAIELSFAAADHFQAVRPTAAPDPRDWVQHVVLPDGSVFMSVENVFEAVISPDGGKVVCRRLGDDDVVGDGGVDQSSFEANLLNFVLSACLTLQGEEPLHATVVELADGRAIGLLGLSGAGKSTLAAYLISQGAELVTDDMLRLKFAADGVLAYPGPYRLKLFEEAGRRFLPAATAHGQFNPLRGKVMVEPRPKAVPRRQATRLAALFHLGDPDERPPADGAVSASRLAGVHLAKALLSSAMDNRYCQTPRLARQIEFARRLAATLPVYALRYPRSFDAMAEIAGEIRRALDGP